MKKNIAVILIQIIIYNCLNAQSFEPTTGGLSLINQQFHQDYNTLVKSTLAYLGDSSHPVIVFTGDTLVFIYQGRRKTSRVVPQEYHQLKAISHLPLGIYTMVSAWNEGMLTDSCRVLLNRYNSVIESAKSSLASLSYEPSLLSIQQEILKYSQEYIQLLLLKDQYKQTERNIYVKKIQQYILADIDESARIELASIHRQTQIWIQEISQKKSLKLYVVIGSSHQARYRELSVQYFDRVLNEQSDGSALSENRLVFAESVFTEKGCLSVLARHIIDQEVGLVFFGDRYRMQRDLLSDSATKYINKLFPNTPSKSSFKR
jgi:hypothetical protein